MQSLPFPPGSGLRALRELLARLQPPDCDCPPLLSCPCGQECDPCKPCVRCAMHGGPPGAVWAHDTCPFCQSDLERKKPPDDPICCAGHCRHCQEKCDCTSAYTPRCHHFKPVDPTDVLDLQCQYQDHFPRGDAMDLEDQIAALLRLAWPGEYYQPPLDLPDVTAVTTEDRVNVLALRAAYLDDEGRHALAVTNPGDRWKRRTSSLGVLAWRARNGSVTEGEVKRA